MQSCESPPGGKHYCFSPAVPLLLWQLMKSPMDVLSHETSSLALSTWKLLIAKTWFLMSPTVFTETLFIWSGVTLQIVFQHEQY